MGLKDNSEINLHSRYQKGRFNNITDVSGVKVGHVTIKEGQKVNTGVTAILPHEGNLFQEKVVAASAVINGFGKTAGLIQVEELGTIETPIILTNTFAVGTAINAVIKYSLERNDDIGLSTGTVNPVVGECNDGQINDIRGLHVTEQDVFNAIENSVSGEFQEGAVGGGTGMVCMGLKGGIGSSSRLVEINDQEYTIGALVMSNFGRMENLILGGDYIGERIKKHLYHQEEPNPTNKDKGSIMIIIATDAALNERQLKRIAKRSQNALGRVGSYCGNGSGDIAIAFTTKNKKPHYSNAALLDMQILPDDELDDAFDATVEAVEEAIISSMIHAEAVKGRNGKYYHSLKEFLNLL